jgi:hypothetical protein
MRNVRPSVTRECLVQCQLANPHERVATGGFSMGYRRLALMVGIANLSQTWEDHEMFECI